MWGISVRSGCIAIVTMPVCRAEVSLEDPELEMAKDGVQAIANGHSPWMQLSIEQMAHFTDLATNSTAFVASVNALMVNVFGTRLEVVGPGWERRELTEAESAFRDLGVTMLAQFIKYGFSIVMVNAQTCLPRALDIETLRIWYSRTFDERSMYVVKQGSAVMMPFESIVKKPMSAIAIFEYKRPLINGDIQSPLAPTLRRWTYAARVSQSTLQAIETNATPLIFTTIKDSNTNGNDKLARMDAGTHRDHVAVNTGFTADQVVQEEIRKTEIQRIQQQLSSPTDVRSASGIYGFGMVKDRDTSSMQMVTDIRPRMWPLTPDTAPVAGPVAVYAPPVELGSKVAENDVARACGVTPQVWPDGDVHAPASSIVLTMFIANVNEWRVNFQYIIDVLLDACLDGADMGLLRYNLSEQGTAADDDEEEEREEQGAHDPHGMADYGTVTTERHDAGNGGEPVNGKKRVRQRVVIKKRGPMMPWEATDVTVHSVTNGHGVRPGVAPRDVVPKKPRKLAKRNRQRLSITMGSLLDAFAIDGYTEAGRIEFAVSQQMLSSLTGIPMHKLTKERLDPLTGRPMAEIAAEAAAIEATKAMPKDGSTTLHKASSSLEGKRQLVRNKPRPEPISESKQPPAGSTIRRDKRDAPER